MKILPKIYKGNIKLNSKNQKSTILEKNLESVKNVVVDDDNNKNINGRIKDLFNSPSYVYKKDVTLELNNSEIVKKTIIGRTNNSLITIDDELIDVKNITRIDFD